MALGGGDGVGVHPQDLPPRKGGVELLLHLLGAVAEEVQRPAAGGAGVGQRLGVAAVVAHEPTVGRVVGQVDGAAGARGHLAALAAGDHAAGPPAVEEENTLLPRLHGGGQPGPEGPAE